MARIRRVIDEGISFYEHQLEKDDGVTLFRGRARFVAEHTIEYAGERVEFEHALVATGAAPYVPAIPGSRRFRLRPATTSCRRRSCRHSSSSSVRALSRSSSRRSTGAWAPA